MNPQASSGPYQSATLSVADLLAASISNEFDSESDHTDDEDYSDPPATLAAPHDNFKIVDDLGLLLSRPGPPVRGQSFQFVDQAKKNLNSLITDEVDMIQIETERRQRKDSVGADGIPASAASVNPIERRYHLS